MDPDYFSIDTIEAKVQRIEERLTSLEETINKMEVNIRLIASMMSMSQYRMLNTMIRTKNPVSFNPMP